MTAMKNYLAAVVLLGGLAACGGRNDLPLEGTTWQLASMEEIPSEAIDPKTDAFTLVFDAEQQMVYGRTNCNRFFGSYRIEERELEFGDLGMTRMACPDMEYEDAFVRMLDEVDGYGIRGEELTLYDDGKPLATFRPGTPLQEE